VGCHRSIAKLVTHSGLAKLSRYGLRVGADVEVAHRNQPDTLEYIVDTEYADPMAARRVKTHEAAFTVLLRLKAALAPLQNSLKNVRLLLKGHLPSDSDNEATDDDSGSMVDTDDAADRALFASRFDKDMQRLDWLVDSLTAARMASISRRQATNLTSSRRWRKSKTPKPWPHIASRPSPPKKQRQTLARLRRRVGGGEGE
jgi:hypothetical protein